MRTLDAARLCIEPRAGAGDQIMVAEGTRYAEVLPNLSYRGGFSATYPTVIQSYDPADPANEARYGRATGARRPVLALPGSSSAVTSAVDSGSYFAFRGLDLDGGNQPGVGVAFVGTNNYVLFENNVFRQASLSFDRWDGGQAIHHVLRKNAFYGQWHPTGHAQGIYDDGTDSLTVEDNVFWHNGWKVEASRDATPADGGPTMFRHAIYTQTRTSALVRRNVFLDPAATGCSCRGDITATENVFIDNPMAVFAGLGNDYNKYRPNGVAIDIGYNLILGDADLNSANPRGQAVNTANGKPGSSVHHNLILRSRNANGPNVLTLNNQAIYDQPSYIAFNDNLVYRFSPQMAGNGGQYPAQVFTTYTNNAWDAAPTATNTSSADLTLNNPITSVELFAILGCGTKDQCAKIMTNSPEQGWAEKIRTIVWSAYKRG